MAFLQQLKQSTSGWELNQKAGSFRFISLESLQDAYGEDIDRNMHYQKKCPFKAL
jgi:hypothetical protein